MVFISSENYRNNLVDNLVDISVVIFCENIEYNLAEIRLNGRCF